MHYLRTGLNTHLKKGKGSLIGDSSVRCHFLTPSLVSFHLVDTSVQTLPLLHHSFSTSKWVMVVSVVCLVVECVGAVL